jgi:hypothetical protein
LPDRVDTLFSSTELVRVRDAVRFGLGWHNEYELCVRVHDGEVYAFHAEADDITYVNKDLDSFAEFLAGSSRLYELHRRAEQGEVSTEEYLDAVAQVRVRLAACDRRALLDGGWWAGIVDEFDMI